MRKKHHPTSHKSNQLLIRSWRPSFVGLVVALLFLVLSLLPSLLPRPWLIQGVISGLSMAIGYGLGVASSSLFRWFVERELSSRLKQKAWKVLKIAAPLIILIALYFGREWQNGVRELLGVESLGYGHGILIVIATVLVFVFLLILGRGVRKLGRALKTIFDRHIPPRLAAGSALIISSFIVYFAVSGLLMRGFYTVADGIFGARDHTAPAGITQPESMYRSGSPESLIPWDKVGFQGRGFVGGGPSVEQLSTFSGKQALEPVRVYAGLASAETAEQRAALAVEELKRTSAFEREVLVIATATGTGWLDPTVVDTLEYMYNGDSAIVSQQYSYLPSWISFLVDQERAREAGRVLYDAVIEEWETYPEADRPKLIVYGLSLGSFGGQEAFSGVNDIRRSVDGALYSGTPNDTDLWRRITATRDVGSPEWQPVYKEGRSVRFASTIDDMTRNQEQWSDETRILFLQHANDPVVWFSFDLLFNKPDWLREERGAGVSSATRWFPIVTFLHVGLDQAIAASAPIGHGHYYIDTTAYAWAAVAPPDNWTVEDSERLQAIINKDDY